MSVTFFDLTKQYKSIGEEIEDGVKSILSSGRYVGGEYVERFEENFASYIGTKHCVGVASGTDALMLSLKVMAQTYDQLNYDEVITVPNTYVATVEAIIHAGYKPVFVDIDPQTGLMDLDKLENKITIRTMGIIPVHLYGQCVDMPRVNEIAKMYELFVIEDACQAHGATFKNQKAGSFGWMSAFSFYPSKNLGCAGDGGAITTNDLDFCCKLRALRDHGRGSKNHHDLIGHTSRLDAIQACILDIKLKRLDEWNGERRRIAWVYDRNFIDSDIEPLAIDNRGNSVVHLYVVKTKDREELILKFHKEDIQFRIHYPIPIHLQEAYRYLGYKKGDFPETEKFCDEIISLPLFPEMSGSSTLNVIRCAGGGINDAEHHGL